MSKVTKKEVIDFLKKHVSSVLASCSEDGPQAATVFYAVDDEMKLFFFTRRNSRKFKNLLKNPGVAMVVTSEKDQITVQMEGETETVEDPEEFTHSAHLLSEAVHKYPSHWPVLVGKMVNDNFVIDDDVAIFKLSLNWMRWGHFKDESKKSFEDCFQEVEL